MPGFHRRSAPPKIKCRPPSPPTVTELAERSRYEIVGTSDWVQNKPGYVSPILQLAPSNRIREAQLADNRTQIQKIKRHLDENGWQMIDGGEMDGLWINTEAYPDELFEPGLVYDLSNGCTVLFPMSDGTNDPRGLAFHFERRANGTYEVVTNGWSTVEANTRRGRRSSGFAAKKLARRKKTDREIRSRLRPSERAAFTSRQTPPVRATSPRLSLEISEK